MEEELKPSAEIRRFDVFAEYNKLKALEEGRPEDEAKGHGLWVAKVVASRRFAGSRKKAEDRSRPHGDKEETDGKTAPREEPRFHTLGDELQTEALFDREVAERMGERFYREVFAPTILRHFRQGDRYESIRDTVRKDWNESRKTGKPAE